MSRQKSVRAVNKPFRLKTFPCQAQAVYEALCALKQDGEGNPRSENFSSFGYLCEELLSRFTAPSKEGLELRTARAIEKLLATEARNKDTNQRLAEIETDKPTLFVQSVLNRAKLVIADIIGEVDYGMFLRGGYSSGSTTSRLRKHGEAASKYDGKGDVTVRAYPYIATLQELSPIWREACDTAFKAQGKMTTRLVEGNVVFTVPKDATIERPAAKEPDYNMYLQRAVGSHIRSCLRRKGVDLNDQTVNQRLAQEGSKTGKLATLDLSAASDSVTTGLVKVLFSTQWQDVLFDLRSERGIFPGSARNEFHTWEMLSSMGNGFTFEVESLIFYSLCKAVAYVRGQRGIISVYGDDLIVPTTIVSGVRRILRFTGFTLNVKKSFYDTPFRESCGKHYYNGTDVTPFYIREPIVDQVRLIHLLNHLRDWGSIDGISDPRLYDLWKRLSGRIPMELHGGQSRNSIFQLASPRSTKGGLRFSPVVKQTTKWHSLSHYIASLAFTPGLTENYIEKKIIEIQLSISSNVGSLYRLVPQGDCEVDRISWFPQEIPCPVVAVM